MRTVLAVLCGLAFSVGGAHAATSTATAKLGAIHFLATDLDTTDGVDAGYTLGAGAAGPVGYGTSVARIGIADAVTDEHRVDGPTTFAAYSPVSTVGASSQAHVSLLGSDVVADALAVKDGSFAESGAVSFTGYAMTSPYAFTLDIAAHTALTISVEANTLASAGLVCAPGDFCGTSLAEASLMGCLCMIGGGVGEIESALRSDAGVLWGQAFDAKTGMLTITLSNTLATSTSAWLVADVHASASVVPEPETYLLMLAGLGVLGAVARRRATR